MSDAAANLGWLRSFLLSRQKFAALFFSVVVLVLLLIKLSISLPEQIFVTFLMVGSFGLFHGALDLNVFFKAGNRRSSYFLLMAVYLSAAALVFCLWLWRPVPALAFFLVISWWHFSLEEYEDFQMQSTNDVALGGGKFSRIVNIVDCFSRGGLIIFASLLAHADLTRRLFSLITCRTDSTMLDAICAGLHHLSLFVMVLLPLPLLIDLFCNNNRASILFTRLIESIMLLAIFYVTGPLIGFAFYFCGVHSLKELARLVAGYGFGRYDKNEVGGTSVSNAQVAGLMGLIMRKCLPMTALAVLIGAGIFVWFYQSLLYCTFVLLSMLTLPHAVLRLRR